MSSRWSTQIGAGGASGERRRGRSDGPPDELAAVPSRGARGAPAVARDAAECRRAGQLRSERVGRPVSDAEVDQMVLRMSSLPSHPEVPEALRRLRETPLNVVALVNSDRSGWGVR